MEGLFSDATDSFASYYKETLPKKKSKKSAEKYAKITKGKR